MSIKEKFFLGLFILFQTAAMASFIKGNSVPLVESFSLLAGLSLIIFVLSREGG